MTQWVDLPGSSGEFISTPDSVGLSVTGDIDVRIKVAMDDWTPAANQILMCKRNPSSGSTQSWQLQVLTSGLLNWVSWDSADALTINQSSSVATSVSDGAVKWVRCTVDVDNGASGADVKFYLSDDGSSWTQLGSTRTDSGATDIKDSTAQVEIGSRSNGATNPLAGLVYYAEILNGIGGSSVGVFDADGVTIIGTRDPTTYSDGTNTWTVNGSAWDWGTDYVPSSFVPKVIVI